MRVIIWGTKADAVKAYEILHKYYEIVGFGENNLKFAGDCISGHRVFSGFKVKEFYCKEDKEVDAIIIPGTYSEKSIKGIVKSLRNLEISEEDIYILPFNAVKEGRNELVKWESLVHLYSLNVKVVEHCNLNCKRCNNFSNLIQESVYDILQYERDIERLKNLVENITCIKLIGGEPLLSKDIIRFVEVTKKYYPYAYMNVVTNGTLILKLDEKIMKCFKENDVHLQITLYPALYDKIDDILLHIKKHGVKTDIFRDGDAFGAFINLKGDNDRHLVEGKDFFGKCVSMCNGKICRCGPGMTIDRFNEKFQMDLPDTGKIDLYRKDLTGNKLMELLDQSIDLCQYCNACLPMEAKDLYKWERCGITGAEIGDYLIP